MLGLNNPLALIGLAAVPLVYFLYTRIRSEPVRVSSVLIWKKVQGDPAGAPEKRRSPDLRLLAYLIAICAGVLAMARPVVRYTADAGRAVVILLDRSASMGARVADGGTRFDKARAAAMKDLDGFGSGDSITVLTSPPRVRTGTVPPADAKRMMSDMDVSVLPGDIEEDIRFAASMQRAFPGSVLRVYTDSLPDGVKGAGPFVISSVGAPADNAAISNAFVSEAGELAVWVRNFGNRSRQVTVTGETGQGKALRGSGRAEPGATLRIRMGTIPESAGRVKVTLAPEDALSADNTVTIAKAEGPSVIRVYGRRDARLEKALGSIPGVEGRNAWGDLPEKGPAVILGTGCASLPTGDVAVVNPLGRAGPIVIEGRKTAAALSVDAPGNPLMESVPVKDLDVKEVLAGRFPDGLRSVVSAGGLPVIATMPNAGGRLLYVGFDISSGSWHTRKSFPIFWYNFFRQGAARYRPEGILAAWESDLRTKEGVREGGAEPAPSEKRTREKDLSALLVLIMIAATAGLLFSGRR
jgi:hypothetical protein